MPREAKESTSMTRRIFADNLDELIKKDGKGLRKISKDTGIAIGTLSKYQNDGAEAGIDKLVSIANYFNVSTDWLLGLSDDPDRKPTAVSELGLSHAAIMEIKNLGMGKYKQTLSDFISDPDFMVFVYQLWEIYDASKRHHTDILNSCYLENGAGELDGVDMTSAEDMQRVWDKHLAEQNFFEDTQEDIRRKLNRSDATIVYGDFLIDLLKLKLHECLNEILAALINNSKIEAEEEFRNSNAN